MKEYKNESYLQEKATMALKEVAAVVACINNAESNIPANIAKELKNGIWIALYDLTKVVATLYNSQWDPKDSGLIIEKGKAGAQEILYKYGCIPEPEHMRKERLRPQFVLRILELSKLEAGEARTLIYDELSSFGFYEPLSWQILELIEPVTEGTKTWNQFQQEIDRLLSQFVGQAPS